MHNFDNNVLSAMDVAQSYALDKNHVELTAYHLLYGLIKVPKSVSAKNLGKLESEVKKKLKSLPTATNKVALTELKASVGFSEWITKASANSIQRGEKNIAEVDLLTFFAEIFPEFKDTGFNIFDQAGEEEAEVPEFLVNLNELAASGKLDPVIGRDKEIRSLMEILGRRGKNNPVLVGEAGVGKTAIVEGLADAIIKGDVADVLKNKTIYSLNLGSLMAGTKFRGEFEERMEALLKYIKSQAGQAILFIDEIHQLVGAGKTEGAMDAANLLKPSLARGDLHCIGATTHDEYQKYILGDSALARRFRSVTVAEPGREDAIEIMIGMREKFEIHHGIKISDEAVRSAVDWSMQYINDRSLPDKCIDLMDEAASAMKLSAEAMPAHVKELENDIRKKSLLAQVESNDELKTEIADLKKSFATEKEKWEQEVLRLKKQSELKNRLDQLKFDLENLEREQRWEEASQIKYSVIPKLEAELTDNNHDWVLRPDHIAQVISRQTGVPLEKIIQSKQENMLQLESYLNESVVGQGSALQTIADTLIASHAELMSENRPLGSFLLKGPSGVGKTETAKSLSRFLFETENNFIKLDLSEFSEKHSVAKLIGAPAGYVGYDEGGVLTEAVRKKPYSIILFDEIEKAHEDFADILLQILDEGRLTDNKGRTISFKNTIIFLTTNSTDLERDFKPEVLGRIDSICEYDNLSKDVFKDLIAKELAGLNGNLEGKKVKVELSNQMIDQITEQGYDSRYGARPLKSVFNKLVTIPLSKKLVSGDLEEGTHRI